MVSDGPVVVWPLTAACEKISKSLPPGDVLSPQKWMSVKPSAARNWRQKVCKARGAGPASGAPRHHSLRLTPQAPAPYLVPSDGEDVKADLAADGVLEAIVRETGLHATWGRMRRHSCKAGHRPPA